MPEPLGLVVKNGTNRFDVSGQALALVVDVDLEPVAGSLPADRDAAAGLERRVDGVADDVDEQLLDLIGVGDELDLGRRMDGHRQPLLELDDPA